MQFDPITYNEARALREHFRIIYGSYDATLFVFDPAVTGASLQTWLGTQANLDAFKQLLTTYIGPAAVIASSTAMAAVIASSTAMAAVAASSTAKMAIHGRDTALNAIKASSTAMAALRAAAGYVLTSGFAVSSSPTSIAAFAPGGTYILLGVSSQNANPSILIRVDNRRSGSGIANTGISVPSTGSDGKTLNLAIPLVGPYTATNTNSSGFSWYFGAIRCDV